MKITNMVLIMAGGQHMSPLRQGARTHRERVLLVAAILAASLFCLVSTLSVADTAAPKTADAPQSDHQNTIRQLTELFQSGQLPPDKIGETLRKRGVAYSRAGEQDRAIDDFSSAIKIKSDDIDAHSARGKAFLRKREYDKALSDFTKAINLVKAGNPKHDCNKFQDAVNLLRCQQYAEAGRSDGNSKLSWRYVDRANAYKQKGKFDLALADYNEALRLSPDTYLVYLLRGTTHQQNGNSDLALSDLNEAVRLEPDNGTARMLRGDIQFAMGKNLEAFADYHEAVRLKARYAHTRRGVIYYVNGDYPAAADDFRASLERDPDDSYSALWLSIVRTYMGQDGMKDLAARTKHLNLERWPGKIVLYYLGKASLDDVMAHASPESPFVVRTLQCGSRYFIGHYHLMKADTSSALSEFRKVTAECPSTSLIHRLSSLEQKRQGQ